MLVILSGMHKKYTPRSEIAEEEYESTRYRIEEYDPPVDLPSNVEQCHYIEMTSI